MTKERVQHIKELVKTAYEAVGLIFACQVADEIIETRYEFCRQCDNNMPIIKLEHECLICGQDTTKNDPNDEDIPLENNEI